MTRAFCLSHLSARSATSSGSPASCRIGLLSTVLVRAHTVGGARLCLCVQGGAQCNAVARIWLSSAAIVCAGSMTITHQRRCAYVATITNAA